MRDDHQRLRGLTAKLTRLCLGLLLTVAGGSSPVHAESKAKPVSLHVYVGISSAGSIYHVPLPGNGRGRLISKGWKDLSGIKAYRNHLYVLAGKPASRRVLRFQAPNGNGMGVRVTSTVANVRAMDIDENKVFLLAKAAVGKDQILWAPIDGNNVAPKQLVTLPTVSDFAASWGSLYYVRTGDAHLHSFNFPSPNKHYKWTLPYAVKRLDAVTDRARTTLVGSLPDEKIYWIIGSLNGDRAEVKRGQTKAPFSQMEVFSRRHVVYFVPGTTGLSGQVHYAELQPSGWYMPAVSKQWKKVDFMTAIPGPGKDSPSGGWSGYWGR